MLTCCSVDHAHKVTIADSSVNCDIISKINTRCFYINYSPPARIYLDDDVYGPASKGSARCFHADTCLKVSSKPVNLHSSYRFTLFPKLAPELRFKIQKFSAPKPKVLDTKTCIDLQNWYQLLAYRLLSSS